ncbi:HTTM domain-containing protein [Pontibacter silvestris]|uniref:HTTM domain-containing protein n=1 Tax=Pontibacter silvestris TaxID=2305183 RepID=A0ABW4WZL4_9BACT|nr:HTTM domain-containing protein [Pontibacter silvestris]MCC9137575.1 HTTM domain-containing protein [Pontibacter silvestris]
MTSFYNYIDRIIFKSFIVSAEALGLYRIFFSLYLLIFGVPVVVWIGHFSSAFYDPPMFSLSGLLSEFPDFWFLMVISLVSCLLPILLLFGYKTRSVSILLALCILVEKSFAYSFGKIDHDFLMWMIPLFMAFSNWGIAFSLDSKIDPKNRNKVAESWPITLLALTLCLAMFSAGLPKLMGGWLDVSSQAVRGHFLREYYFNERQDLLAPLFLNLESPFIWEVLDYAGVLMECLFLFALVKPNIFRAFVLIAIVFHVLNYLLLNISFSTNYILYMLFIDWKAVISYFRRVNILSRVEEFISFKSLSIIMGLQVCFFLFYLSTNYEAVTLSPANFLFEQVLNLSPLVISGFIMLSGLLLSLVNAVNYIKKNSAVRRNKITAASQEYIPS